MYYISYLVQYTVNVKKKKTSFIFPHDHMAFLRGEMNGESVQISRLNSSDFAGTFRREICYLPEKKGKPIKVTMIV